jgi:hypothetical protein
LRAFYEKQDILSPLFDKFPKETLKNAGIFGFFRQKTLGTVIARYKYDKGGQDEDNTGKCK